MKCYKSFLIASALAVIAPSLAFERPARHSGDPALQPSYPSKPAPLPENNLNAAAQNASSQQLTPSLDNLSDDIHA